MSKYQLWMSLASLLIITGCDEPSPISTGLNCQDSVKILTPNPANSVSVEHICSRGSRLKVTDKDQSLVAVCRCPENAIKSDVVTDGGVEEKK